MSRLSIFIIILSLNLSCGTKNNPTYEINVSVIPLEGGEIEIIPDGAIQDEGTNIMLTAIPSEGYLFAQWEGDYKSTDNPLSFTLKEDISVSGIFEKKTYPLNVTKHGEGIVAEKVVKAKTDYEHGTTVELTTEAESGWSFVGWSGDLEGSENPTHVTVESELNISANFSPQGVRMFGGSSQDLGREVIETSDGGYLIVGSTRSADGDFQGLHGEDKTSSSAFAFKLDDKGKKQWVKTYGGNTIYSLYSAVQAPDGGYLLAGRSQTEGAFGPSTIVKIDSGGNILWSKTYGAWPGGVFTKITQTQDGGYIAVGGVMRSTFRAIHIFKIDANGNEQWGKYFEGGESATGYDVIQTADGNFVFTGTVVFSNESTLVVYKLDPIGNVIWVKWLYGSKGDVGTSIARTSDSSYLVAGYSYSNDGDFEGLNNGNEDVILLKLDTNGNTLWIKNYGGTTGERGYALTKVNSGGFVISGSGNRTYKVGGVDNEEILVIQVDSNGNEIWTNTFGGVSNSHSGAGNSVLQTPGGGFLVGGTAKAKDGDFYDYYDLANIFVIKLDANGNITPFN